MSEFLDLASRLSIEEATRADEGALRGIDLTEMFEPGLSTGRRLGSRHPTLAVYGGPLATV